MLQFQALSSRRFQHGFDRVNLHRPAAMGALVVTTPWASSCFTTNAMSEYSGSTNILFIASEHEVVLTSASPSTRASPHATDNVLVRDTKCLMCAILCDFTMCY